LNEYRAEIMILI